MSPPVIDSGNGRLAQLVEHSVYIRNVGGSTPSPPTIFFISATFVILVDSITLVDRMHSGSNYPVRTGLKNSGGVAQFG